MEGANDYAARLGALLLDPAETVQMSAPGNVKAAVLVPLYVQDGDLTAVFTRRPADMRRHAGEISFPGGRRDDDEELQETALREAEEEIGLDRSFVETLCRAPDYLTGSGYHVAPVIAIVRPGFQLRLNPAEVADAFEVPLRFLMDPANHRHGSRIWHGARRTFFEMPYEGRHIWGITAGMVRILYERLYADPSEAAR